MNVAAAFAFTLAAAVAVAFQLALAGGARSVSYAMGGRFPGVLPPAMRGAAVVQGMVIAGLAVIVLGRRAARPEATVPVGSRRVRPGVHSAGPVPGGG